MEMPDINLRIKQLVEYYANNVVNKFAKDIGIAQQSLNRIFNIDTRTKKFPTATTEMLVAIIKYYKDVNVLWLMIGEGEMLNSSIKELPHQTTIYERDPRDIELIETQKDLITSLKLRIKEFEHRPIYTRDKGLGSAPAVGLRSSDSEGRKTE